MKQMLLFGLSVLCVVMMGCERKADDDGAQGASSGGGTTAAAKPGMKTVTTASGLEMVLIPAGSFKMGDDRGEEDERPAHQVQVGAFLMDKYEVTQASYESIVGKNPSKHKGEKKPVDQVSWYDAAIKYCNTRSRRENLTPCYDEKTLACNYEANGYRLPTEAEWEYACRAGTSTKYASGNNARGLKAFAWFKDNARGAPARPND